MSKDIKAIFFDLDDTLCDYLYASHTGLKKTFSEYDLGVSADEAFQTWRDVYKTFAHEIKSERWYERYLESGEPTRTEHMRRMLKALNKQDEDLAKRLSETYANHRNDLLKLFPETTALLSYLHGKYVLGMITNGPADIQREEVETLGIGHYFDHILIEGEVKIGKPHNEIFDEGIRRTGFRPEQHLFVGNAFEHDVQGAKSAGWYALWVNKENEQNPGTAPQPDGIVVHLFEVCDWLGIDRPMEHVVTQRSLSSE